MPKRINNIWKKNITFSNLLMAHNRAKKGKRFREEVIKFEINLEENLIEIGKELLKGEYNFGKYREFTIYEPKERHIKVLPYRDRIVHQLYVEECLKPIFVKNFIKDSYACIKGRGVHQAILKLHKYMKAKKSENNDYYILKCDISKYFYTIPHNELYKVIEKRIKDRDFLYFTKKIIFCNEDGKLKNFEGVNFCGYKLFNDRIILKKKNKTRLKRWFKKLQKMYSNNEVELEEITRKIPSIKGYLKHCRSYRLYESILGKFVLKRNYFGNEK